MEEKQGGSKKKKKKKKKGRRSWKRRRRRNLERILVIKTYERAITEAEERIEIVIIMNKNNMC